MNPLTTKPIASAPVMHVHVLALAFPALAHVQAEVSVKHELPKKSTQAPNNSHGTIHISGDRKILRHGAPTAS